MKNARKMVASLLVVGVLLTAGSALAGEIKTPTGTSASARRGRTICRGWNMSCLWRQLDSDTQNAISLGIGLGGLGGGPAIQHWMEQ